MKPDIAFGDFARLPGQLTFRETDRNADAPVNAPRLVKSLAFQRFRDKISAYIYALIRSLEFEACWLISCQSIDFKILLGEKMGFDAMCLESLHHRMFEKLVWHYVPTVNADYSQNFDHAVGLEAEGAIAAFLFALSQNLSEDIQQYLAMAEPIADAPTERTLRDMLAGMKPHLERLQQWSDQRVSLQPLEPVLEISKVIPYSGSEPIPAIAVFPGRPVHLHFSEQAIVRHQSYAELMTDAEKLKRFSHYVYMDVEVAAMEVCAKNIVAYRQMPLDFKLDMARQIWDEARHAIIMRRLLEALGGKEGDYTYSAKVWKKCEKGANLLERLAIEQVFQEGNALESNFLLTESFRNAGNEAMTLCMDFINADEAIHVKIGNFWLKYLLNGDYAAYQATLEKAATLMKVTLSSNVAIERTARKIADFPEPFVDLLEANNQVYGYRKA